jgi:PAS domain S-box-containing protein
MRRSRRLSIPEKVLVGFGLTLLILATVAAVAYWSTRGYLDATHEVARMQAALERSELLRRHLVEARSSTRGYIISGDAFYLQRFNIARDQLGVDLSRLQRLVQQKPEQLQRLERVGELLEPKLTSLERMLVVRREQGAGEAAALFRAGEGEQLAKEVSELMDQFQATERNELEQRVKVRRKHGETARWVIITGTVLTLLCLGVAGVMIIRDALARRRAEEALANEHNLLKSIIDALPDLVSVKDRRGRFFLNNAMHRKHLNVREPSDIESKTDFNFYPHEMASLYTADDQGVMVSGKPLINWIEPTVDYEGNLVWLSTTKVPLRDSDGEIIGLVTVSTDITERKQAEEKLRLFATQLERSNRELQEFAYVASHDLQEPLRKIQAFGDRLKKKSAHALDEQGLDYLGRMQDAAQRMQGLIHGLLMLARVTSAAHPFEPVDLGKVIGEILNDLELRIEQTEAEIEVGELPVIDADALQMRQLFYNLLNNALKFHKKGQRPVISIFSKVLQVTESQLPGASPHDAVCQIHVTDNGIGFDAKYAERIFDVFQRLHSRSEFAGTGIGLAVCRKIVDRHGGTITAKSAEGQGATFVVTLPVKQHSANTHEAR